MGLWDPRWFAERREDIALWELEQAEVQQDVELQILEQALGAAETTAVLTQQLNEAAVGLSPEGGNMASTDTIQTMRATGGFTLPTEFKSFLPLILVFLLFVFVIIKK